MNNNNQLQMIWQSVWQEVLENHEVSKSQVDTFFSRIRIENISGDVITLVADTSFIKDWVAQYYLPYINQALFSMFGSDFNIILETADSLQSSYFESKPAYVAEAPVEKEAAPEPFAPVEAVPERAPESNMPEQTATPVAERRSNISPLTFENFVIGESNRMAFKMALTVAEQPGKKESLNPLFIYGKSGLGKTHLLCSIKNYINDTFPYLSVIYADSSEFLNDYTDASAAHDRNKQSFINFKSKYEEADVLLIDDVQFFEGKKGTLDNMFQILNKFLNNGKQIVLSADRAPKNIGIDERYSSRFAKGGVFDIQAPEIETKLGIIKSFVDEYNQSDPSISLSLSPEIQTYIAENSSSNIRELKGALTSIIEHKLINPDLSFDDIKRLLEQYFGPIKRLTISDIQECIEEYYHIKHGDLIGKKRSRDINHPRQVCIYLCRELLDSVPYKQIGKAFGRDHSTAIYACSIIERELTNSRELQEEIEIITKLIKER